MELAEVPYYFPTGKRTYSLRLISHVPDKFMAILFKRIMKTKCKCSFLQFSKVLAIFENFLVILPKN